MSRLIPLNILCISILYLLLPINLYSFVIIYYYLWWTLEWCCTWFWWVWRDGESLVGVAVKFLRSSTPPSSTKYLRKLIQFMSNDNKFHNFKKTLNIGFVSRPEFSGFAAMQEFCLQPCKDFAILSFVLNLGNKIYRFSFLYIAF